MKSDDNSLIAKILKNPVGANILMVLLVIGGIASYTLSVREIFPEVNLDIISVTVPYPGADPEEIEEAICRPMEESLEGITGVKKVKTFARENVGMAVVEIFDGYNVIKVKNDIENKINNINTFPTNSEKPLIAQNQFRSEVLMVAVWGKQSLKALKEVAYDLKEELVALPEISSTTMLGDQDYEISIEVAEDKLLALELTYNDIANILRANSLNLPGGEIETKQEDIRLRFVGRKYKAEEYGEIVIKTDAQGGAIRLKDIATIKDSFNPDNESISLFNGQPCVIIKVNKTGSEDSITISQKVREFVKTHQKSLPPGINLDIWSDNSRLINDRIDLLTRNGVIGLCLVFFILWLFLDFRLSFWVTMGIPISISGAFIVMYLCGLSINMISLFALILVLGIIVDDAIIVGESIYVERENLSSVEAAVVGTKKVFWPVFSSVITTVVAFIPLFFIDGIFGKFIFTMPIPIIAALLISLCEAFFILPTHLRHLPRQRLEKPKFFLFRFSAAIRGGFSKGLNYFVQKIYTPILKFCLVWRYAVLAFALCVIMVIAGMFQGGFLKVETFPSSDTDFLFTDIVMPVGTPLAETKKRTEQLIASWRKTEEKFNQKLNGKKLTVAIYSITGSNIKPDNIPEQGSHLSSLFVEMLPTEERNIYFKEILEEWNRQTGYVSGAEEVVYDGFIGGPPTSDVDVIFRGKDNKALVEASEEFKKILTSYNGVFEITSSYKKGKNEYILQLKPQAEYFGINMQLVASQLRDSYYGNEIMKIQRDRDEVRVMLRLSDQERQSIDNFYKLRIRNKQGEEIPLSLVVDLKNSNSFSVIERENGERYINVQASVVKGLNANDITADLKKKYFADLEKKYGVKCDDGFNAQDMNDTRQSMKIGFSAAILIIYLIIATVFKSYIQPVIIVFTIPFGLVGAIFGHYIYDIPVSTMSFFGMIALTGIVVNDAIVYIEAVNEELEKGEPFFNSLVTATHLRFRAIILTTVTTFFGIFPLILEKSLQAQVLIPMAIAVAFGLLFATFATLIIIPSLLFIGNDLRRLFYLIFSGTIFQAEEVEPRSKSFYLRRKRRGII